MTAANPNPVISRIVAQFRRAAIVAVFGYEDEDDAMQKVGIASAKRAIEMLDTLGPADRPALTPLLDDPDWSVRAFAAGYLLRVAPERSVAVLREIDARCPTQANWAAHRFLSNYNGGKAPP